MKSKPREGKKHNGGSDDQGCLKKSIKNQRNAQKNYSIFLWSGLIQIDDIVSFDFQNLQYLISLLA